MKPDPHCRIGRIRLKGRVSRKIGTRLPLKFAATTARLLAELAAKA